MAYDYSQSGWSPDVVDYATRLANRRNELIGQYAGMNTGFDNPDFLTPMQVQQPASDEIRTEYLPEEVIRAYMAKNPDIAQSNLNAGVDLISYGGSRDPSVYDMVRLPYGGAYTFTDKNTGQTYTASTPEQLSALAKTAMRLSTTGTAPMKDSNYGGGNNVANWEITDASGKRLAYDLPYTAPFLSQVGQTIADIGRDYVLPIGLSVIGGVPGAVAGSFLSGTMQDKSTEDLALGAALSGATTYGMQQLSPYINRGLTDAGLGGKYTDLMFSPQNTGVWGPYSSGVSPYSSGTFYMDPITGAETVRGLVPSYSGFGGLTASALGSLTQLPQLPQYDVYDGSDGYDAKSPDSGANYSDVEGVVVPGTRLPAPSVSLAPVAASALNLGGYNVPAAQRPVESVEKTEYRDTESGLPHVPVPFSVPVSPFAAQQASLRAAEEPLYEPGKKEPSALDKYLRYASLGLTGASLLGGLFGGSGGTGAGGTIPAGFGGAGKLPPGFGTGLATLPTGSAIPAFGGGVTPEARMARTAADLGDIDYLRYGFGPERSFFANVPVRAAKGGSMAVKPISDGRSDDIPAVLSDGEYVMDAETVALLGNGSNKAGAAKLDRFRANLRKHKGKELAKGRFSVDAKKPQAYLAGGKT